MRLNSKEKTRERKKNNGGTVETLKPSPPTTLFTREALVNMAACRARSCTELKKKVPPSNTQCALAIPEQQLSGGVPETRLSRPPNLNLVHVNSRVT